MAAKTSLSDERIGDFGSTGYSAQHSFNVEWAALSI
jgi:hypothetical protein